MSVLIANNDDAASTDEWSFGLKPEDTALSKYQPNVVETNQPRAVRAHRRHLKEKKGQQHRFFWLPRRHLDAHPNEFNPPLPSDSEDETPRRERLIFRTFDEASNRWDEGGEKASLSFVAQHQKLERTHPDISPHSCTYCRHVSVDLRRQRAYQFDPGDDRRPKGWRVQPSRTGLTHGEALAAANEGCPFFSFVVRILRIPGLNTEVGNSLEVTVTGMMQGVTTLGFSVQRRDQKTTTQSHNLTQSLTLYTVPGRPGSGDGEPLPSLTPNRHQTFARDYWLLFAPKSCAKLRAQLLSSTELARGVRQWPRKLHLPRRHTPIHAEKGSRN